MAPAQSRIEGADFLSCTGSQAPSRHRDFIGARNRGLGSPSRIAACSTSTAAQADGRRLVGGLATWCRGVLDQIERAVPDSKLQKEALLMIPSFGTCIPTMRCGPVALTAGTAVLPLTGRRLRLQSTVTAARKHQRGSLNGSEVDDEDLGPGAKVNSLASHAASQFREASLAISSTASMGLAAFLAGGPKAAELRASACGILATMLTPLASGGGVLALAGSAGGPAMAFCPMPFDCLPMGKGGSMSQWAPIRELTMQELEKGVLVATFVQGSLGIIRMCLGDVFSGCYGLLLATLGYNSRRPGPASNWLKTYVLITFINGTMSGIDLIQQTLLGNYLGITPALPLAVNCAHLVTIAVPWVSFLGAYCGWQHIKMQRKAAIEAYQEQMMMLMQQPPWPPPPLPFPLPGMTGLPGMPGFQMVEDGSHMPGAGRLPTVEEVPEESEACVAAAGNSSKKAEDED